MSTPTGLIATKSLAQVYLEIVAGVLADSGLTIDDVDGFHSSMTPGGLASLADTLGLRHVRHFDGTDLGGATYVSSLGTAARAIASGDASVVLVVMAGLPRRGMFNRAAPGRTRSTSWPTARPSSRSTRWRRAGTWPSSARRARTSPRSRWRRRYHASVQPGRAAAAKRVTVEEVLEQSHRSPSRCTGWTAAS